MRQNLPHGVRRTIRVLGLDHRIGPLATQHASRLKVVLFFTCVWVQPFGLVGRSASIKVHGCGEGACDGPHSFEVMCRTKRKPAWKLATAAHPPETSTSPIVRDSPRHVEQGLDRGLISAGIAAMIRHLQIDVLRLDLVQRPARFPQ
jgi:hypothetical protein